MWKMLPSIAVWCRELSKLKGPAPLSFFTGQLCMPFAVWWSYALSGEGLE